MKYALIILLLSVFCITCENDHVPSGIEAEVFFAPCDSLPVFTEYNGRVYFVPESKMYEITDSLWESKKSSYPSAVCTQGSLSLFIEPGKYIARPDTFRNSLPDKILQVEADVLLKTELKLMNCR